MPSATMSLSTSSSGRRLASRNSRFQSWPSVYTLQPSHSSSLTPKCTHGRRSCGRSSLAPSDAMKFDRTSCNSSTLRSTVSTSSPSCRQARANPSSSSCPLSSIAAKVHRALRSLSRRCERWWRSKQRRLSDSVSPSPPCAACSQPRLEISHIRGAADRRSRQTVSLSSLFFRTDLLTLLFLQTLYSIAPGVLCRSSPQDLRQRTGFLVLKESLRSDLVVALLFASTPLLAHSSSKSYSYPCLSVPASLHYTTTHPNRAVCLILHCARGRCSQQRQR